MVLCKKLRGWKGALFFFVVGIPGHLDNLGSWWRWTQIMPDWLSFMFLGMASLLTMDRILFWISKKRWFKKGKDLKVDAGSVSHNWDIPQPTVTLIPPPWWKKLYIWMRSGLKQ